MTLLERIQADRAQARKDGDNDRRDCLGFLIAEAQAVGKRSRREPTDEEVIGAIRKIISQNDEVLQHRATDEAALRDNQLLKTYLPVQMDETRLSEVITAMLPEGDKSPRLIGSVMGRLKAEYPGQYDPALASRIAKNILTG